MERSKPKIIFIEYARKSIFFWSLFNQVKRVRATSSTYALNKVKFKHTWEAGNGQLHEKCSNFTDFATFLCM